MQPDLRTTERFMGSSVSFVACLSWRRSGHVVGVWVGYVFVGGACCVSVSWTRAEDTGVSVGWEASAGGVRDEGTKGVWVGSSSSSSRSLCALMCSSSEDTSESRFLDARLVKLEALSRQMGRNSLRMLASLLLTGRIFGGKDGLIDDCLAVVPLRSEGDRRPETMT